MVKIRTSSRLSKRHKYQIQATLHEGVVAVSGEKTVFTQSFDIIKESIIWNFNEIGKWIEQNDGVIDHLKGFVLKNGESMMISTTGETVSVKNQPGEVITNDSIKISLVLIAFGISQLELEDRLIGMFDRLALEKEKNDGA